jgi:hypothetical protein
MGTRPSESGHIGARKTAATDHAAVGVGICDHNLRFVAINLALARIHGVSHERHFGRQIRDILGRASKKPELACERVLDTQQSLSDFTMCEKLPGRAEVGLWTATLCPIKDEIGRIKGVGFLVIEIGDRWAEANPRLSDGQLVAPLEALGCLGLSERAMRDQTKLLSEPRWAPQREALGGTKLALVARKEAVHATTLQLQMAACCPQAHDATRRRRSASRMAS